MSLSKLAPAVLAGLLAASPALAQPARPAATRPAAAPTAAKSDSVARATAFRLTPERPVAGQAITLSYAPAGTPLAGKTGVRAVVYYFTIQTLSWRAEDLPLQPGPTAGELTGRFTPPTSVGFTAYKFVAADGTVDNNHDEGYLYMLGDPAHAGLLAAGANAGYGLLRRPEFGFGVPGYFNKFTISDVALSYWLSQELRFHPENGPALMPQFLGALKLANPDSYQPRARRALALAGSQPNLTEVDLLGCYVGYATVLADQHRADSLALRIRQRFPQGYLVRQTQYKEINVLRDPAQKLARWEAFLQAYPPSLTYEAPARYAIDYDRVYQEVILLYMAQKNYQAIATYAPKLRFAGLITTYYRGVMSSIRPELLSPAQALPYATLLMQRLDALHDQRPAEFAYLSPQEWRQYHAQTTNPWRIHYAGLLAEQGQYAQARPYAEAAQQVAQYGKAELNDTQAALLHQGGAADQARLRQVLEASVHHNQASPRMLDWLRESYAATHPGGAGYDQYLAGLRDQPAQQAARAELAKTMLNKPIADFALRDLDGKLVRLSEQKGKTVVLDFWATWCVPCKASFPGMKLAQDRFKNDPNVAFFFIDTEETAPDYKQQVREYLTQKGFPFRVLFDEKAPGSKTMDATYSTYGQAYHISGIPQKLVIDPQGRLRFLTDGYKGSPTALADEIEAMVELARTTQ